MRVRRVRKEVVLLHWPFNFFLLKSIDISLRCALNEAHVNLVDLVRKFDCRFQLFVLLISIHVCEVVTPEQHHILNRVMQRCNLSRQVYQSCDFYFCVVVIKSLICLEWPVVV